MDLQRLGDYIRGGRVGKYISLSRGIFGWTRGDEAFMLARVAASLRDDAVIVEVGSFLGCSTVILAGSRRIKGSGAIHAVDPFNASGDTFSAPYYEAAVRDVGRGRSQRDMFEASLEHAGLLNLVTIHQGTAADIALTWRDSIDMLFLDGDQSDVGARVAYEAWSPFLVAGGIIAIHNSTEREYEPDHGGSRRLVVETIHAPDFKDIFCVGTITFATRC